MLAVAVAAWFGGGALFQFVENAVTGSGASGASAAPYTSDEFDYTVEFPGEPKQSTLDITVDGADLSTYQVLWTGDAGLAIVQATKMPAGTSEADPDASLTDTWNDMVALTNSVTGSQTQFVDFQGERAISGTVQVGADGEFHTIIVMRGAVEYRIIAKIDDAAVRAAFVESFRFTN